MTAQSVRPSSRRPGEFQPTRNAVATITTGLSKSFSIPGISWAETLQPAFTRSCRTEEKSYSRICNITWKGSKSPMIRFATSPMPQYWATAKITGWGRGVVTFTNYASLIPRMKAWSADTWMGLFFHELGHILGYTRSQAISYPPSAAFVARLVKHWGKPKAKGLETSAVAVERACKGFEVRLRVGETKWLP